MFPPVYSFIPTYRRDDISARFVFLEAISAAHHGRARPPFSFFLRSRGAARLFVPFSIREADLPLPPLSDLPLIPSPPLPSTDLDDPTTIEGAIQVACRDTHLAIIRLDARLARETKLDIRRITNDGVISLPMSSSRDRLSDISAGENGKEEASALAGCRLRGSLGRRRRTDRWDSPRPFSSPLHLAPRLGIGGGADLRH